MAEPRLSDGDMDTALLELLEDHVLHLYPLFAAQHLLVSTTKAVSSMVGCCLTDGLVPQAHPQTVREQRRDGGWAGHGEEEEGVGGGTRGGRERKGGSSGAFRCRVDDNGRGVGNWRHRNERERRHGHRNGRSVVSMTILAMLLAARFLVSLQIFSPATSVVATVTRELEALMFLLHVTLQRPWSHEFLVAAGFAADELWMIVGTDHVCCEVVGVMLGLATTIANVFLESVW